MQDQSTNSVPDAGAAAASAAASKAAQSDFLRKIVEKTKSSENILIALSKDPSVDDIAAAIGLTLYLDGMGKHVTAIYSGRTPDELNFLQPGETFEKNTDSLQDFIVSLNKDKADHLRYKLEGDFVKVFITPYKARLTQDDLEFSYGDYNVDFVIAINVPALASLDDALHEHGRVLHDAPVVDITTNAPGKFGEIEWSNPMASSVCEMVTELIFALQDDEEKKLERDIATALLTGIVAATERFSNNRTNSDTMGLASKLMSMGADQQLITANVHGNDIVHNDEVGHELELPEKPDVANLMIEHEAEANSAASAESSQMNNNQPVNTNIDQSINPTVQSSDPVDQPVNPADSVNPAMQSTNPAAQAAPELNSTVPEPAIMVSSTNNVTPEDVVVQPVIPGVSTTGAASEPNGIMERQFGASIQPPTPVEREEKNYAEMMAAALAEPSGVPTATGPIVTPDPVTLESANTQAATAPIEPMSNSSADPASMNANSSMMDRPRPNEPIIMEPIAKTDAPVAMEPIAKPEGNILPPPPTPDTGMDMMPPVLPPVQ